MSSNFQQRDMSGVLFRNDKGDNPSRPDYRGEISINGEVYELASWVKDGNKGKFMSLSAKLKEQQKPQAKPRQQSRQSDDDLSDVPF